MDQNQTGDEAARRDLGTLVAWGSVLLVVGVAAVVWIQQDTTRYEPRYLLTICNTLFLTIACVLVSTMGARTLLSGGSVALLPMGTGTFTIALASVASGVLLGQGRVNAGVVVYISGMCFAAAAHLVGAIWLTLPVFRKRMTWHAVAACYLAVLLGILLAVYEGEHLPPFVENGGATTLRKVVAGAAIAQFILAAGNIYAVGRYARSRFLLWYAVGLLLIAIGLIAVTSAAVVGNSLTWTGRAAQWLGGVYLLVASTIAVRQSGGLSIPLHLLRETQQRYASLVELCPDAILVYADDQCVFANAAAAQLLSCPTTEALLGRSYSDLIAPAETSPVDAQLRGAYAQQAPKDMRELRIMRLDGTPADVELRSVGVEYDGAPALLVVMRDITERKRVEAELRQREAQFRHLADAMPQLVWPARADGAVDYFNSRSDEYPSIVKVGDAWNWISAVHPEEREISTDSWQASLRDGNCYEVEQRVEKRGGVYRWHLSRAVPVRDEHGKIVRWYGTSTDIHDQRQAREALRTSEQRYHSLFDSMSEGFGLHELILDNDGKPADWRFLDVNASFERLTGMRREDVVGRLHSEVLPDDDPKWLALYGQVALTGVPAQFDNYSPALKRHYEVFAYRTAPLQFAVIFMDITQRTEIEAELRRASAAKDQFIASLSHELRTPLTPVVATVSALVRDPRLPADVNEELAVIERNIALEVHLINDLLDVTRIVSGKLELRAAPTDVSSVLRDVGQIVAMDADAKQQTLTIDMAGPCWVMADRARLHQVFWNLIRNAIKFSPSMSRVRVTTKTQDRTLWVAVEDQGPGIAKEDFPRLFRAFEQGSAGTGVGGLGLGLAICKGIIDLHGGTISAANCATGAVFTISLPLMEQTHTQSAPADEHSRPDRTSLRILLVEDHKDTARVISRLLREDGHSVAWVSNVKDAIAAATSVSYDLIISDLGLPDGSGHDFMETLKASGVAVTAIAVSGYGGNSDVAASLAAGFAEHLTKPVSFEALRKAIARLRPAMQPATGKQAL